MFSVCITCSLRSSICCVRVLIVSCSIGVMIPSSMAFLYSSPNCLPIRSTSPRILVYIPSNCFIRLSPVSLSSPNSPRIEKCIAICCSDTRLDTPEAKLSSSVPSFSASSGLKSEDTLSLSCNFSILSAVLSISLLYCPTADSCLLAWESLSKVFFPTISKATSFSSFSDSFISPKRLLRSFFPSLALYLSTATATPIIPAARRLMPFIIATAGFAPKVVTSLAMDSIPFGTTLEAFINTAMEEKPATAPVNHSGLLTKNSPILMTGFTNSPKPSALRLSFGYNSSRFPINPSEA